MSSRLCGADICGETTLVVTNKAQKFTWNDYGLVLDIPANALPQDINQCKLHIMASISGDYEFPNGFQPVSPIIWICCEPNYKFNKAILMGIQHCAKAENISKLRFMKASCTPTEHPYLFKLLPADKGNFSKDSPHLMGLIHMNNFSGTVIGQDGSDELSYTAKLFYFTQDIHHYRVHFTVTMDECAHRTVSPK